LLLLSTIFVQFFIKLAHLCLLYHTSTDRIIIIIKNKFLYQDNENIKSSDDSTALQKMVAGEKHLIFFYSISEHINLFLLAIKTTCLLNRYKSL